MSICSTYLNYLDHFGPTQPVRALHEARGQADLLALRHDVDHDLDVALEMAWLEHEHGCRSTYYLLHNQSYADDEFFLERCLQLQTLGHEVGVHNDSISAWFSTGTPVADSLAAFCGRLRGAGVEVLGTSTHGAKECYTHGYLNSWCFRETRAAAQEAQDAFNAEGLPERDPMLSIRPPQDGRLKVGKRVLQLWTVGLADLGLKYEAGLLQQGRYFTDSGGSWSRSADPLDVDLRHGRAQVLMHPEWWTRKPRTYFFLSTARSGSKWLAGLLRDTTSATVEHEFSLNHEFVSRTLKPVKRTGTGFRDLMANPKEVPGLLRQIRSWRATLPRDFVECNVYLGHFIHQLKSAFPDATLVHLHRDSRAVARSLRQRGWYDTPEDDRHPSLDVPDWDRMTQLEKICRYIGTTNEAIRDAADHHVALEDIVGDADGLLEFLRTIGLRVLLPDLFRKRHPQMVDPTFVAEIKPFVQWPARERAIFHAILDPVQRAMGYSEGSDAEALSNVAADLGRVEVVGTTLCFEDTGELVPSPPYVATRCALSRGLGDLRLEVRADRKGHAHLRFGAGTWHNPDLSSLLPVVVGDYYRLEVRAALTPDLRGRLQVLQYDDHGRLISSRNVRELAPESSLSCLSFRGHDRGHRQSFALYFPQSRGQGICAIESIRLFRVHEQPVTPLTPAQALADTDRFYAKEQGFGYSEQQVTEWLRREVMLPASGRVLDLCCGDGIWSKGIQNINRNLELFGIDLSEGGIQQARRLLGADKNHFVVGDAEKDLPFTDGFFDLIFARGPGLFNQHDMTRSGAVSVIEHWHHKLAPDGRFWAVYGSNPALAGSYTPAEDVILPYNRVPRLTRAVDFLGGKYHHTEASFRAPFIMATGVSILEQRFVDNVHIVVSALATECEER